MFNDFASALVELVKNGVIGQVEAKILWDRFLRDKLGWSVKS